MSRVGKSPVPIPDGVQVTLEGGRCQVRGPKGELQQQLHEAMNVRLADA